MDDRGQCLLGEPPRRQKAREIRVLPELGDAQLDRPDPRLPHPVAVATTLRQPLRALLAQGSARLAADVELPRRAAAPPRPPAKQPGPAGPGGSRSAAKPSISRSRSASVVFSNSPCRAIISLVIASRACWPCPFQESDEWPPGHSCSRRFRLMFTTRPYRRTTGGHPRLHHVRGRDLHGLAAGGRSSCRCRVRLRSASPWRSITSR